MMNQIMTVKERVRNRKRDSAVQDLSAVEGQGLTLLHVLPCSHNTMQRQEDSFASDTYAKASNV